MKIEWDPSIEVGVARLDEDHRRLVSLLNYLENYHEMDVRSEAVALAIEHIREYASLHFRHEEAYMQSIDYPDMESHKQAHKQFKERTGALCIDVMNKKEGTPKAIYDFLFDWISRHILREDKKVRTFNEAKSACEHKSC